MRNGYRRRPTRLRFRSAALHAASLVVAAVFILPYLSVLSGSLRLPGPPPRMIEWFPRPLGWSNYVHIFQIVPLARFIFNSLAVVFVAVPLTLVTASWAGFAMAQLRRSTQRVLMVLTILILMAPVGALWLPRFVLFRRLGLIDSFVVLIIPALMGSSPLFVLLFYWTFRRVPMEVWEAARLEGASLVHTWRAVGIPLARPTVVAVGALAFALYWNDFVSPLLYLRSERRYTLPVGLQLLQQLDRHQWPLLLAAAVVMTVPVVLVFALAQRYFIHESRYDV